MRSIYQDDPLSDFIAEFLDGCGIEPPFYLVSISSNSSVYVTHWPVVGQVHEVCAHRLDEDMVLPIVLTVVSLDGRGASARIEKGDHGPRLLQ
jgi:hypothetical protein